MSRSARSPGRVAAAVATAGTILLTTALATFTAGPAAASSHREAPLISADPAVDNTDVYAFVSPDKPDSVTFVANWFGLQEPNGGPTFYPWATDANYDINIDTDGDARPDIGYRLTFRTEDKRGNDTFLYNNGPVTSLDDENLLYRQYYTLSVSKGGGWTKLMDGPVAPSPVGAASIPDYAALRDQAVKDVPGGGKTYVGSAEDPFFADLRVFDVLYGGDLSEVGQDTLAKTNVNTWALQLPVSEVTAKGDAGRNPVIGVWSDTERRSMQLAPGSATAVGEPVQVSRLGNPLVNEVVLPAGLKDAFNGLTPNKDATIPEVVARVTDPELPKLLEGIYQVPAPKGPRNDLVEIFLTGIAKNAPTLDGSAPPIQADLNSHVLNADTDPKKFQPSEMLRLNTSVPPTAAPNRLGVLGGDLQGFPNGRRLGDDVIDISVQAVAGAAQTGKLVDALATGDKVDANDVAFGTTFPYVALPSTETAGAASGAAAPPAGGAAVPPPAAEQSPAVVPTAATGSDTVPIAVASGDRGRGARGGGRAPGAAQAAGIDRPDRADGSGRSGQSRGSDHHGEPLAARRAGGRPVARGPASGAPSRPTSQPTSPATDPDRTRHAHLRPARDPHRAADDRAGTRPAPAAHGSRRPRRAPARRNRGGRPRRRSRRDGAAHPAAGRRPARRVDPAVPGPVAPGAGRLRDLGRARFGLRGAGEGERQPGVLHAGAGSTRPVAAAAAHRERPRAGRPRRPGQRPARLRGGPRPRRGGARVEPVERRGQRGARGRHDPAR